MAIVNQHICKDCGWVTRIYGGGPYETYVDGKGNVIITYDWEKPIGRYKSKMDGYYTFDIKEEKIWPSLGNRIKALFTGERVVPKTVEHFVDLVAREPKIRGWGPQLKKIGTGKPLKSWKHYDGKICVKCGSKNMGWQNLTHMRMNPPKGFVKQHEKKRKEKLKEALKELERTEKNKV